MSAHHFDPTILRAYDIRGIFEDTLTHVDAFHIGLTFITMQRARGYGSSVVVGRDGRLSSPTLAAALVEGLVAGGAKVADIGCGPTPMLYFAAHDMKADGAIQVTGSHNPPQHNGFKMMMGGASFFGEDIILLGDTCAKGVSHVAGGSRQDMPVEARYIDRITAGMQTAGMTVVWDCGNGAAGDVTAKMVGRIEGEHHVLFSEIDGTFPNHHPNPVDPETLKILRAEVKSRKAHLGIGFDGDGDRIGVVDARGRQVPGDLLTAFIAQDVATRHDGKPILLDVKSSDVALELLRRAGASPEIWKTGHSHMKKRMKDVGAPLAGEMSGHIFIEDGYFGFDDAIYAGLRVIDQSVRMGVDITAFMDSLPEQHATPEMRVVCPDAEKFAVMDRITTDVVARMGATDVSTIDGVRVRTDGGWWLLRASNTEAVLIARAEADSKDRLDALIGDIGDVLNSAGLDW